jgi:sulfate permease, SulP family
MGEEDSDLSWSLLHEYENPTLWVPAFVLAAFLRAITHKYHHQLIVPACTCLSLSCIVRYG